MNIITIIKKIFIKHEESSNILKYSNWCDDLMPDECENEIEFLEPIEEKSNNITEYSIEESSNYTFEESDNIVEIPYESKRMIIKGCHLYFIDIAREIVLHNKISIIPLMREYKLSEAELKEILSEIYIAGIIDKDNTVLMSSTELEKFFDIYEPNLFKCVHGVFDKEILLCIGEILFFDGIENVYDSLPADEVIDYLNILEKLKVIKYDCENNQYQTIVSYNEYKNICQNIPNSFSSIEYNFENLKYINMEYDNMTGIEFEHFIAHVLDRNNFINIKITPSSGDHGVDLLAEKDNITYAIQCKCYSSNIGNNAVQQAHTGKSLYKKDIAVVVTNQYFTQQAKDEANALGVKLWDRDILNKMIKK